MEKEKQEILVRLVRVLNGEACQEDMQKLATWLVSNEDNCETFRQAESIWNALEIMTSGKKDYNAEEAFNRFKETTGKEHKLKNKSNSIRSIIDWTIRVAAIIVIIIGSILFLSSIAKSDYFIGESFSEIVSPRGSKVNMLLPDGTKVWLNSDSKIKYGKDYNQKDRIIYLVGEGYFEVARKPDKPFIVNTSDINIKALGTTFNIKSYPNEKTIETTLIEGKVVLERNSLDDRNRRLITLGPNQKAIYFIETKKIATGNEPVKGVQPKNTITDSIKQQYVVLDNKANVEMSTAWKNNRLCFENESFQNLSIMLERRFGVTINFMDENIKHYRFSGKFYDIIIEQVLLALQYASPFYYLIKDNTIYISEMSIDERRIINYRN